MNDWYESSSSELLLLPPLLLPAQLLMSLTSPLQTTGFMTAVEEKTGSAEEKGDVNQDDDG